MLIRNKYNIEIGVVRYSLAVSIQYVVQFMLYFSESTFVVASSV